MALTSKEKVFAALERRKCGSIPTFPLMISYIMEKCGSDLPRFGSEPEYFVEQSVRCRKEFGYDANCAGAYQGTIAYMTEGMKDKTGAISTTGDATVLKESDLDLLRDFDPEDSPSLQAMIQRVKRFKIVDPDVPVLAIFDNAPMSAAAMMDAANYYVSLINNKPFVRKTTERLMEPIIQSITKVVKAGADIIWLPMPTLGGTCMRKEHYRDLCMPYNAEFNQEIRKTGAKIIYHTCGNWNDRFDLVYREHVDAWHVTLADLALLKLQYGNEVCLIGQIPSAFTMLMKSKEEVYEESMHDCLIGAKGGGFMLSPDCGLPGNTPAENIHAMVQAAKDAEKQLGGDC